MKDSKRVYAKLLYSNINNDGFKKEGSTFPSKIMQQKLMDEFFLQSKIDPNCVNFVEAHATGTAKGDPEEVAAIDAVFCKNKNRTKPLPIGSVKSNMVRIFEIESLMTRANQRLRFYLFQGTR
jgi:fatty acid synthase, animal type